MAWRRRWRLQGMYGRPCWERLRAGEPHPALRTLTTSLVPRRCCRTACCAAAAAPRAVLCSAGVDTGDTFQMQVTVPGKRGPGGRFILTIPVEVEPHPVFQRKGYNIVVTQVGGDLGEGLAGGGLGGGLLGRRGRFYQATTCTRGRCMVRLQLGGPRTSHQQALIHPSSAGPGFSSEGRRSVMCGFRQSRDCTCKHTIGLGSTAAVTHSLRPRPSLNTPDRQATRQVPSTRRRPTPAVLRRAAPGRAMPCCAPHRTSNSARPCWAAACRCPRWTARPRWRCRRARPRARSCGCGPRGCTTPGRGPRETSWWRSGGRGLGDREGDRDRPSGDWGDGVERGGPG